MSLSGSRSLRVWFRVLRGAAAGRVGCRLMSMRLHGLVWWLSARFDLGTGMTAQISGCFSTDGVFQGESCWFKHFPRVMRAWALGSGFRV